MGWQADDPHGPVAVVTGPVGVGRSTVVHEERLRMRDPHPESIGASLEVSSQNTQRRGAEGSERRITICGSYHRAAPPGNAPFVRMRNSGGPGTPHLYECVTPRCLE